MLNELLACEAAHRSLEVETKRRLKAEEQALIDGLHAAFRPEIKAFLNLTLKGDYDAPIHASRVNSCDSIQNWKGLEIRLGYHVQACAVRLLVERTLDQTLQYRLRFFRSSLPESDVVFPVTTPVTTLLRRFFALVLPHLHDSSFSQPE